MYFTPPSNSEHFVCTIILKIEKNILIFSIMQNFEKKLFILTQ